ncbi:MAG TPA: glycosyltransferase family 4 protein [Phycisphaerae bacterium]|nr:glycosyltransferase family 4 protein [Phycisphaerae bacterium]
MKIAMADFIPWDYNVESVYQIPLGGTQSAACYLCEALAQLGHDAYLLTNTTKPGKFRGVHCLSLKTLEIQQLRSLELDAFVLVMALYVQNNLRTILGSRCKLIFWTGHAHDQPGVQAFQEQSIRDLFDGFAFISLWQAEQFHKKFGIDQLRMGLLRYAASPFFIGLFKDGVSVLKEKSSSLILAYTSTPFRGLNVLLDVFPAIRAQVPGIRLQIFSSMKVYMTPEDQEAREYGALYQRCRQTEGVEYIGSLPQPELSQRLRQVAVLAYPNTFPETSCISVIEAMAAGCRVVTSELGALPETTAGFAKLIPVRFGGSEYQKWFINETVGVLKELTIAPETAEQLLRRQITFVNNHYTWGTRAAEWISWIANLPVRVSI